MDLIVASTGDQKITFYRNFMDPAVPGGSPEFVPNVVFDGANFAFSIFAADFDMDGDIDVASASYVHGALRWYVNLPPGDGSTWGAHAIYEVPTTQGRCVVGADLDGDGDT